MFGNVKGIIKRKKSNDKCTAGSSSSSQCITPASEPAKDCGIAKIKELTAGVFQENKGLSLFLSLCSG